MKIRNMVLQFFVWLIWILAIQILSLMAHLPSRRPGGSNANIQEKFCDASDRCIHDTIPVCGQMDDKKRTFLDICDMLEYSCDKNQVFVHIEDEKGCPVDPTESKSNKK